MIYFHEKNFDYMVNVTTEKVGSDCYLIINAEKHKCALSELMIFEFLYLNMGCVVERDELSSIGWPGRVVSTNSVPVAITNLRKILREHSSSDVIITEKGVGYYFTSDSDVTLTISPDKGKGIKTKSEILDSKSKNSDDKENDNDNDKDNEKSKKQTNITLVEKKKYFTFILSSFFKKCSTLDFNYFYAPHRLYAIAISVLAANIFLIYFKLNSGSKEFFEVFKIEDKSQFAIYIQNPQSSPVIEKALAEAGFHRAFKSPVSLKYLSDFLKNDEEKNNSTIRFINPRELGGKFIIECIGNNQQKSIIIDTISQLKEELKFTGCES